MLKINFYLITQVTAAVNLYLKLINNSRRQFCELSALIVMLTFIIFLTGLITVKGRKAFLTMVIYVDIHSAGGAGHDDIWTGFLG